MTKKATYHTRLDAVCSGNSPDELFMVGIRHQMPDPIADLESFALATRLTQKGLGIQPLFNGADLIADHYSRFNCMVRDSAGTLYVGEDDGVIRYRSGKPEVFRLTKSIKLQGLVTCAYVRGNDDVVFGSSGGTIIHLRGDEFTLIKIPRTPADATLDRIHGIGADFMVSVGGEGFVVCYRNEKWEKVKSPANSQFKAVWCRSPTEIYIGGWFGRAWRWDGGSRWQPLEVEFAGEKRHFYITDFAEYGGTTYAACCEDGVYRLEGDRFVPVPKVSKEIVSEFAVTNLGLIGLGAVWGEGGDWFTRFDGTKWTTEQVNLKA